MGPEGRGDDFEAALARLRRSGSALLVAGAVPEHLHERACADLLGHAEGRLFVTAGSRTGRTVEPAGADSVVRLDAASRGAATDTTGGGALAEPGGGAVTTVPTVSAGGGAVEDALAALDTSGEFHVCVDAALPVAETVGEGQAFRFLHLITSRVRRLGGTCHVHLPLPAGNETTGTLAALADATVELRLADDRPEQRWHVHGDGIRSAWLPLSEP